MSPLLADDSKNQLLSGKSEASRQERIPPAELLPRQYGMPPKPNIGGMARLSPLLRVVAVGTAALDVVAPYVATELMLRHFTRPRRRSGHDYRSQLPLGAQHLSLLHKETKLTGWTWGTAGPSVLLVHGWEDHSGSMLGFVDPLRALGYRVCVLDLPGHGLSPQTATHLLDTSLALEKMVGSFGPFHSIVAHSYGAAAVCLALRRQPSLMPKQLALISPMQDIDQHLRIFASIAQLSPDRTNRLRNRLERLLGCPPEQLCALAAVQELDVSAVVIHDRHDPVIPHDAGELLARNLRGARFISTSHLGHRSVLKCPSVLARVLDHHRSNQFIA